MLQQQVAHIIEKYRGVDYLSVLLSNTLNTINSINTIRASMVDGATIKLLPIYCCLG